MNDSELTYRKVFGEEVEWKPVAPVTFWLTRHGVSEYNLEDRIGGDSNITTAGQIFADTLPSLFGKVLQESGDDHRFVSVWTSTLLRTIQTASKLPLPQVHLKELDEINAGVCDGATYEYIKKYMPYIHYNRKKDKLGYRYPSGESYIDLCKRVWPIVRQLKAHGGSKLIVGHQAVLRCIFGYLEGRPLKDITHLSVPHHQIFQFTVHSDGTVTRKDFHMDQVRDPDNPDAPIPGWPFDVSHSRPLTATDIARYSPKPLVPLLINRVASLSDAHPASSKAADANGQGIPPPALPPVLPDPETCASVAANLSTAGPTTANAPVAIRGKRPAAEFHTEGMSGSTSSVQFETVRMKKTKARMGGATSQGQGSRRLLSNAGMQNDAWHLQSCKSHTAAMPCQPPALGGDRVFNVTPTRLNSAPGDLLGLLETFQESSQPSELTNFDAPIPSAEAGDSATNDCEPDAVFGSAVRGSSTLANDPLPCGGGPRGLSPNSSSQSERHSAPCLPEHLGGSLVPCSIPEKCGSLLCQSPHASAFSSDGLMRSVPVHAMDARQCNNPPTVPMNSCCTSISSAFAARSLHAQQQATSCSAIDSRARSGDLPCSTAGPSMDNSPLKPSAEASSQSISNRSCTQISDPPEVRCMACGAMVPVHARACDIKPSRLSSVNGQSGLMSYLPEGIASSMTLSSHAADSCPNSKRPSYTIESAFDFEDNVPRVPEPMVPGAASFQHLSEGASSLKRDPTGFTTATLAVGTPAIATPSPSSPSVHAASAVAERAGSGACLSIDTPQLELRESVVHNTCWGMGVRLNPLNTGSEDPDAEYPGSPCAPYPLIATPKHQRQMSELAAAFQELRTKGTCSNNIGSGTGGPGSSFTEGVGLVSQSGRLSLPRGLQLHGAGAESPATDDPCIRAEELRRKLEDSQGFHFRGEASRLVESGLRDQRQSQDVPVYDPHMHQPADLAW